VEANQGIIEAINEEEREREKGKEREIPRLDPCPHSDAPRSMIAEIAKPSARAMTAQKQSSRAMRPRGSPKMLKGVKNSQNRNAIRKTRSAKERPRRAIPGGQAGLIQR